MRHLIYRLATVGLLILPLLIGPSDVWSAKKQTKATDSRTSLRQLADSTKVQKTLDRQRNTTTPPRHVVPNATANPSPRVPRPTAAGDVNTQTPATQSTQGTAAIENNWISINHGGATEVSAGNLKLGISIAQPVAGYVEAGNYQLGLGYWYGAAAGGTGTCDCPDQADLDQDDDRDNVDLNIMITIMFFNGDSQQSPNCPAVAIDFNCDGTPDNVDLNWMIDHLFSNGPDPCNPCACNSYPSDCPSFP